MFYCEIYRYVADNEYSKKTNKNAQAQNLQIPCCRLAMVRNSGYIFS